MHIFIHILNMAAWACTHVAAGATQVTYLKAYGTISLQSICQLSAVFSIQYFLYHVNVS